MIGRIENCIRGYDGVYHMTISTRDDAGAVYDEYNGKDVSITVETPRRKRSLNANSYLWELCGKIAEKLDVNGVKYTKDEVYQHAIREVGVYRDIPMLANGVDTLRKAWSMHGTGWVTDIVDYLPDKTGYLVRCYYGSSTYSSKQMNRLISSLQQDCEQLGIEYRTPEEVANMLSLWEQERSTKR